MPAAGCCARRGGMGRLAVATLMWRMGMEALYRRPNTSKPAPVHKSYPSLLRRLAVDRSSQIWTKDISYIVMARGFVYLPAVDHAGAGFVPRGSGRGAGPARQAGDFQCRDQCRQFTSQGFKGLLQDHKVAISMDSCGAGDAAQPDAATGASGITCTGRNALVSADRSSPLRPPSASSTKGHIIPPCLRSSVAVRRRLPCLVESRI